MMDYCEKRLSKDLREISECFVTHIRAPQGKGSGNLLVQKFTSMHVQINA